jgi:hypothetical protein
MRLQQVSKLSLYLIVVIFYSCDKGIEPLPSNDLRTGFGGKITFIGQWPDSVKRTHLVVFASPLNSVSDFNITNLRFVSQEIPFGSSEYIYSSRDSSVIPGTGKFQAGNYAYVAVAQSFTEEVLLERRYWFVAGLYFNSGDFTNPGTLSIPENTYVDNINIICDFDSPPPQPPGGN